MKQVARDVFLMAFDFDWVDGGRVFKHRAVKRSKKCYSIWQVGHGWAMLLPRTCTWDEVKAMLEQLRVEGSL